MWRKNRPRQKMTADPFLSWPQPIRMWRFQMTETWRRSCQWKTCLKGFPPHQGPSTSQKTKQWLPPLQGDLQRYLVQGTSAKQKGFLWSGLPIAEGTPFFPLLDIPMTLNRHSQRGMCIYTKTRVELFRFFSLKQTHTHFWFCNWWTRMVGCFCPKTSLFLPLPLQHPTLMGIKSCLVLSALCFVIFSSCTMFFLPIEILETSSPTEGSI